MSKRKGKLERAEARYEELRAEMSRLNRRSSELAIEGRSLQAELRTAPAAKRPEMRERLKDIERELKSVRSRREGVGAKIAKLAPIVVALRKRLQAAEQNLDVLEAGSERTQERLYREYSPHTLRAIEQRARETIRELMG